MCTHRPPSIIQSLRCVSIYHNRKVVIISLMSVSCFFPSLLLSFDMMKHLHEVSRVYWIIVSIFHLQHWSWTHRHTFRRSKSQLILPGLTPWRRVSIAKHIWMQLPKLNRGMSNSPHPFPLPNVLGNKGSPDRNGLQWPAASTCLEAYTARVFITENTEGVEVGAILDLTVAN